MTESINFVPPRVPLVDPRTGTITREWYLFLQGVFLRIGGASGPSTPDLLASLFEDAGSGETNAMLFSLEQDVGQTPFPAEPVPELDIAGTISALQSQVAELQARLDDLQQSTLL